MLYVLFKVSAFKVLFPFVVTDDFKLVAQKGNLVTL